MKRFKKNKKDFNEENEENSKNDFNIPKQYLNNWGKNTDEINIVMSPKKEFNKNNNLDNINLVISQNYDVATKKIISAYEEILESGAYVTTQYLAVQVSLYLYEKKLNIKIVHKVINEFVDYTWKKIAQGKIVAYTNEIILESILYIDKIIPAVTVTPSFANMVNAIKYEQLFLEMVSKNLMSPIYKEVIDVFIEAIEINLAQGYRIQLREPIILKTELEISNNMILFSDDTLRNMNDIFRKHKYQNLSKKISTSDAITHFVKSQDELSDKKIEKTNFSLSKEEYEANVLFNKFKGNEEKKINKIIKNRKKQQRKISRKEAINNTKESSNVIN